ncbi:MAG TPA: dihydroxy-acid dehydratase, partial [Chitinophagaceae bacterium]|nr:dihydroxy-acid dehydratase [Chitinophagaceae bacterium]
EASDGGPIALLKDGDIITIDASANSIEVQLSEMEIDSRKMAWMPPALKYKKGILYKYSMTVSSASKGCVTDGMIAKPD